MGINYAAASLLVWVLGTVPMAAISQPQVGATDLAQAKTLLESSRADLTADQFALLSGRLAAAEGAYAELAVVARASQAAAVATEGAAVSTSARLAATGSRVLVGAAELLPLLVLLWPATAHAPGLKQEKPEVRAARLKAEEKVKELSQAAREVEAERRAAVARPGDGKQHDDPGDDDLCDSVLNKFQLKMAEIYKREHETKRDALGTNKNLSKFDLCGCKDGRVVVKAHGCKGPIIAATDYMWK